MNDLNRNVELMTLHFVPMPISVPFFFLDFLMNSSFPSAAMQATARNDFPGRSLIADAPSQNGKKFSRQLSFGIFFSHLSFCRVLAYDSFSPQAKICFT